MNGTKRMTMLVIAASLAASSLAFADDSAKKAKVMPEKMNCEEFLAMDEVTRPKVIYWAEGFNKKGKADDVVFDTERTDRLVPVMVEVCGKEPKASFWSKVKAEWKKLL
jgi:hypothetical protein